jgi:N-acetylglutamate synthase-like GNAT family acetyltransferase
MELTSRNIVLRPAEANEQVLIWRMVLDARLNPLNLNWENFVLAESEEGKVLGCGQIKKHSDGSRELASVYVIPEERSKGIASSIIERLLVGRSSQVWLTCRRDLIGFYTRFGFSERHSVDKMPAYFRRLKKLIDLLFSGDGRNNPLAVMCREYAEDFVE